MIDVTNTLPHNGSYSTRDIAGIRFLVVHHTGVDVDNTPDEIALYHMKPGVLSKAGAPGIGYHYHINYAGEISQTQRIETMSYNVSSRNHEVVGVVMNGDFTKHHPFEAQKNSLRWLLAQIDREIPNTVAVGHREIALQGHETICPGASWDQWRLEVIP